MLSTLIRACAIVCIATVAAVSMAPQASANSKYSGIVVDAKTGKVLYANHANSRRYPASLTKIMTLYVLFEELEAGRMSMSTRLKASRHSAGMPPSKVGLRPGQTISVKDAIGALVTKSANDVAATVAENIAGSEPAFARRMTKTARRLGMRRTQFRNASGLPNSQQWTTAADMARLGRAIQERFPTYYKHFSTRVFTYNGRRYGNHNRLLGRVNGVDGIKTGYIRASGFNLVTSVRKDGRHIVAVVFGGRTGASRDAQMRTLIAQYLPKASRGPKRDSIVIARKAPLPNKKPFFAESAPQAPIVVANVPLPPVLSEDEIPDMAPETVDDLVPPAIAEGDADPESTIETASVLPAPKAINTVIARAHALAKASELGTDAKPATPASLPPAPIAQRRTPVVTASVAAPAPAPLGYAAQPDSEIHTASLALAKPVAKIAQPKRPEGWHVQIAAAPTKEGALAMLEKVQAKAGTTLRNRQPFTEAVESKGETLYRARFAGFPDQDAAVAACKALKKAKIGCYATQ
ncbi:D-alanyl-D-alanine carboxypeptidase [Breoghania sp.]|uniref:D-alanyl-D-alanine carboxypeptidase n=1 Tax=Breoghania sp. TaxID=2065378 RepID=UPI002AABC207|nr:D-alanyl-D-alanine carboxypeptidase [Breoghania sp.]